MEGKRENLKKALGITEYPWSSDDEDHDAPPLPTTTDPDVSVMPMSLTCTSAPTVTNTSTSIRGSIASLPLASSSVRRPQAPSRIERNLFWSLLCNPDHVEVVSRPPRCSNEGPQRQPPSRPSPVSRPAPEALLRSQRTSPLREIRGLLAYKKATRYVPNRRPRPIHTSINVNRSPGHMVLPTRNPLFGAGQPLDPRIRRAQGNHSGAASTSSVYDRPNTNLNRSDVDAQPSTSSGVTQRLYDIDHGSRPEFGIEHSRHEGNIDRSSRHEGNIDRSSRHEGNMDHSSRHEGNMDHSSRHEGNIEECMVLDQDSDDEMDSTPQRSKEDADQTPENINDETVQREAVSLEEEVLVVGAEEQPSAINATDGAVNPDADNANQPASSTPNIQQDDGSQSPKRKVPNDEEFKELNTNLLRLLECPVCMEWMEPPMSQCRRGHLVCVKCRARLSSCPVCRTTFSSVRNRAMEGVAEMLRYPCRHGCGREVRLRRRTSHEANCPLRRYACPSPCCGTRAPLPTHHLHHHLQTKHPNMLKIGRKQKFTVKLNAEQHDNFVLMCFHELFHLKIDVDIRTWGLTIYAAYIGPKKTSKSYIYEVAIDGKHNGRKIVYSRTTHSDLESASLNVSRHDCFHLSISQALNFLRVKNRHFEADNTLNVGVTISQNENEDLREDSCDS